MAVEPARLPLDEEVDVVAFCLLLREDEDEEASLLDELLFGLLVEAASWSAGVGGLVVVADDSAA